jgi:hypothetical protein
LDKSPLHVGAVFPAAFGAGVPAGIVRAFSSGEIVEKSWKIRKTVDNSSGSDIIAFINVVPVRRAILLAI